MFYGFYALVERKTQKPNPTCWPGLNEPITYYLEVLRHKKKSATRTRPSHVQCFFFARVRQSFVWSELSSNIFCLHARVLFVWFCRVVLCLRAI